MIILNTLEKIGEKTSGFINYLGNLTFFTFTILYHCFQPPYYGRQVVTQIYKIGYLSFPVVGLTAIFTGMVLALQSYTGFSRFSAGSAIATVVVVSITRELGPVLTGLMVAGRVGSSMAAEIGTMRVTEQVDALVTLSTNPYKYLIAPRVIASVLCLPILVLCADAIGIFGGYLVGIHKLGFNPALYLDQTFRNLEAKDVNSGLIKAAVFGFVIALFGCYQGYRSRGGAQGVGNATTNAVVTASVTVLTLNYILTAILFGK